MTTRRVAGVVVFLFLAFYGPVIARAVEQTVLGQSFLVKDPKPGVDPSVRSVVALGKELQSDDALVGDPLQNGASITIVANGANPGVQTFTLPAGTFASGGHGWKASGSPPIGFTWKDPAGQVGPVKAAQIKRSGNGTFLVKAVIKGALGPVTVLPPAPGTDGGMIFTIDGGDSYCVNFGGPAGGALKNAPARGTPNVLFKIASNKTAHTTEAGCPQPAGATTTVTTTSSTSTLLTTTSSSTSSSSSTSTSTSVTTSSSTSNSATTSTSTSTSTSTTSTAPTQVCGNGIREGTEECDDGNEVSGDACTNHCTIARCGDGVIRTGVEQCDDGNTIDTDCCRNDCTKPAASCGNGCIDPGETCDDGNTVNGDNCPSTCVINPCTATTTAFNLQVSYAKPSGTTVGALTVFLDYPDGRVSIPGSGAESTVVARISNTPASFSSAPFDFDYAMRETLAAFNHTLNAGAIFNVQFDVCSGATAPRRGDFTCTVEQASTPTGGNITPLTGFSCSVTVL